MNGESNINIEMHVNKLKPCPLAKAQTQPESKGFRKTVRSACSIDKVNKK